MTSFFVMLPTIFCNLAQSEPKPLEKLRQRKSMIVAMAFLVLSSCLGCANENRQKIVGSWTMIKADRLAQRVNVAADSAENNESESTSAVANPDEADLPMMTLDFRSSGQLVTTTRLGKIDSEKQGRWRMIKFDPPSTMTIECYLDQQSDQSRQLEVTWIDDETIRMTPPNMSGQKMKLNFKKQ